MLRARRLEISGMALWASVSLAALGQAQPGAAPVEEQLIGEVDPRTRLAFLDFAISPDGRRIAWKGKQPAGSAVVLNGTPGPTFRDVAGIALGPGGSPVAYRAKQAGKWVVVRDGEPIGGTHEYIEGPSFAPDGRVVYLAGRGGGRDTVLMIDGQPHALAALEATNPIFSLQAYLAEMLDGAVAAAASDPAAPAGAALAALAREGGRMAHAARLPDGWHMVIDGVPGPAHPGVDRQQVAGRTLPRALFSWNGERLAYMVTAKGRGAIVVDGKEHSSYSRVLGFRFSADSKRYAYVAIEGAGGGARGRIVIDGEPGPVFRQPGPESQPGGVTRPSFSWDGAHVAYAAQKSKDSALVLVDHVSLPGLALQSVLAGPSYGPGGRLALLGWQEEGGKPRIVEVVDGKIVRGFASERGMNFAEQITFSPDGARLAYVLGRGGAMFMMGGNAGRARRRVVVDGVEGTTYDADDLADLTWRGDGASLAYRVRRLKGGKDFVVLDGQAGPQYDEVFAGRLRIDDQGRAVYLARSDRRLLRVVQAAR